MSDNAALSGKERAVFESLLSAGRLSVREIAKATLINRTALYHTLTLLVARGLVRELPIESVRYYEAITMPEYQLWKERRTRQLGAALSEIESLISRRARPARTLRSNVKYYEGREALKNLYAETWRNNPNKEILAITDYQAAYEALGSFFDEEYFPDRIAHGVKVLNLLPKDTYSNRDFSKQKALLREMRFTSIFKNLGIEINIFNESVAIFSFDKSTPTGILLENRLIAGAFEELFRFIWKRPT